MTENIFKKAENKMRKMFVTDNNYGYDAEISDCTEKT